MSKRQIEKQVDESDDNTGFQSKCSSQFTFKKRTNLGHGLDRSKSSVLANSQLHIE